MTLGRGEDGRGPFALRPTARSLSIVRIEAERAVPGPVGPAEERHGRARVEMGEHPGSPSERAQSDPRREIKPTMAESLVVARARRVQRDVAVEQGWAGSDRIDDLRADLDLLEV